MARIENGARIEQRARTLAPFDIEFSCKPQRFLKAGEDSISFNAPGSIYNQYFYDAKPFVTIYGIGSGKVYIGGNIINILNMDGVLYIDSETLNAYNEKGNQNRNVKINNFPVLKDGENLIAFDGNIASVTIKPRWWVL
jgi:phage-related protein